MTLQTMFKTGIQRANVMIGKSPFGHLAAWGSACWIPVPEYTDCCFALSKMGRVSHEEGRVLWEDQKSNGNNP